MSYSAPGSEEAREFPFRGHWTASDATYYMCCPGCLAIVEKYSHSKINVLRIMRV